jgi:hypothetical protein
MTEAFLVSGMHVRSITATVFCIPYANRSRIGRRMFFTDAQVKFFFYFQSSSILIFVNVKKR